MPRFTRDPPFPDACRTGRRFITPCCTASATEFLVVGVHHRAFSAAGHGWAAFPGRIGDTNHSTDSMQHVLLHCTISGGFNLASHTTRDHVAVQYE